MIYHTGAANRDALPNRNVGCMFGCFFSQPSALPDAVLQAASESTANSLLVNGLLVFVAPPQGRTGPTLTPFGMSPLSTAAEVKVRASLRLGGKKTTVPSPASPSSFLICGTSPETTLSASRSVAQVRAGLYIS